MLACLERDRVKYEVLILTIGTTYENNLGCFCVQVNCLQSTLQSVQQATEPLPSTTPQQTDLKQKPPTVS